MDKEKINKVLGVYSRILLAVFGISLIMSAGIMIDADNTTCYYETGIGHDVGPEIKEQCIEVDDIDVYKDKFSGYKLISIVCLAFIFAGRYYDKKVNE